MLRGLIFFLSVFLLFSCGGSNKDSPASMEQLHAENGIPVSVRQLETEDFSVFLKYPAVINASSESTARSLIDDIVREISANVGQTVKQGDVIVSFSSDNRTLQQAVLAHDNAGAAFNRASALYRSNDISRQDFDSVRMQYELSQTNLKAANDMVYVKAPISGVIAQLNVHVTESVRPGMPLFTVSNSNAFEARIYVGVEEIERVKIGARAFIDLPKTRQGGQTIEGRVTQVSLIMDSQKQAFPITVSFDGMNYRLVSGLSVDILVEAYRNENAIILSRQELAQTENGLVVFAVENTITNPQLKEIIIQTGEENGMRVEIVSGLSEGMIIISEGAQRLRSSRSASGNIAETKINIVPAIGGF